MSGLVRQNECLICGEDVKPSELQTDDEKMEFGVFGSHLKCREAMTDEDIDKFIAQYEAEQMAQNN